MQFAKFIGIAAAQLVFASLALAQVPTATARPPATTAASPTSTPSAACSAAVADAAYYATVVEGVLYPAMVACGQGVGALQNWCATYGLSPEPLAVVAGDEAHCTCQDTCKANFQGSAVKRACCESMCTQMNNKGCSVCRNLRGISPPSICIEGENSWVSTVCGALLGPCGC